MTGTGRETKRGVGALGGGLAVAAGAVLLLAAAFGLDPAAAATPTAAGNAGICTADPAPPEYYSISLVPTKRVPGTGSVQGTADVLFGSTPFGVSLAPDGSYRYELEIRIRNLPRPEEGTFVAWVTTPGLDRIEHLGPLSKDGTLRGTVAWNKFLVVVTLEPEAPTASAADGGNGSGPARDESPTASPAPTWSGPIVLRGMSRSGAMHTMAGHGPFQQENCAAYGF